MTDAIGVARPRIDAQPKVRGQTRYAADLAVPGLAHARLVLASEAHASIVGIHTDAALALPGVVRVLTAADLPLVAKGDSRSYEPLARQEVVFAGQPVAIVVAESEALAEDAVEAVTVDYTPLEVVVELEKAMAIGAPTARRVRSPADESDMEAMHAAVGGGEQELPDEELSENVLGRCFYKRGDCAAALAGSDAVVEARFETSWVHQGYIEPQAATAWVEGDELVVSSSTQGAFAIRDQLAELFALPLDKVRVRAAPLGGAFGGKLGLVEPLAAAAALVTQRPVRLALTRSEDLAATNPAPAVVVTLRIGGTRAGELTGIEARVITDRGANVEWGLEDISSILVCGPYRWQAYELRGYGVQTNRVTMGAYRAPGAPPAAFALESLVDELAQQLAFDPIELRLRNAVVEGDASVDGTPFPTMAVREVLESIRAHPLWQRRSQLPPDHGVGVALAYWPGGNEPASAACRLDSDGYLTVITGAVDMSGTDTAFAAIAAQALGLTADRVRVVSAGTDAAPYSGASGGSKVTYTTGRAVQRAAGAVRQQLLAVAADELEIAPADLEIIDGVVRAIGAPERAISVEELARKALGWQSPHPPIEGHGGSAQTALSPSSAAHLVHVQVERETGAVMLHGYVVCQDVGRALNPALVEGQMRGGAAQAIGWALYEELAHDEYGQLQSGTLLDYAIPPAERVPPIETLMVEVPSPDGPFGAKGIGEAPVIAGPAAIANGIAAAVGVRMRRLPMSAPRIWSALRDAGLRSQSG